MNYHLTILSCFFVLATLFCFGCGGEKLPPGMPKLYPATITVTQDGQPLAGAEVILLNTDPSTSWSAGGMTDQNGVIKLRTLGRYDGAPAGKYRVAVEKIERPNITLPEEMPTDPEERKEYNRLAKELADNTFYVVDPKFGLDQTTLEVEITLTNLNVSVDVSPVVRKKVPPLARM